MSELGERQGENLKVARAAFEAFQRGDLEGVLALTDPTVEIYLPPTLPNSGTYHGHEGYVTWLSSWLEAWEHFELEVLDMEAVGERHVVTSVHQSAKGKGSGIPVEMEIAYMSEARDGKYVALQLYMSRDEAVRVAKRREAEGSE